MLIIYFFKVCTERQFLSRNYTPRKPGDDLCHRLIILLLLEDEAKHLTPAKLNLNNSLGPNQEPIKTIK